MNVVILSGKIIEKKDIQFVYNRNKKSKNITRIEIKIETEDDSIIEAYGYNEIADMIYSGENEYILIEGRLNSNMQIEIGKCEFEKQNPQKLRP